MLERWLLFLVVFIMPVFIWLVQYKLGEISAIEKICNWKEIRKITPKSESSMREQSDDKCKEELQLNGEPYVSPQLDAAGERRGLDLNNKLKLFATQASAEQNLLTKKLIINHEIKGMKSKVKIDNKDYLGNKMETLVKNIHMIRKIIRNHKDIGISKKITIQQDNSVAVKSTDIPVTEATKRNTENIESIESITENGESISRNTGNGKSISRNIENITNTTTPPTQVSTLRLYGQANNIQIEFSTTNKPIQFTDAVSVTKKISTKIDRLDKSARVNKVPLKVKRNESFQSLSKTLPYKTKTTVPKKLILIYTPLFGSIPWRHVPLGYKFTELDNIAPCPINHCDLTYDKNKLNISAAVLFHGRDLPNAEELRKLRHEQTQAVVAQQKWIWVMHESPMYTYYNPEIYNGIFNWTATYRPESEVFIPYFDVRKFVGNEAKSHSSKNFASGKDKMVLFINSHCDSLRMNFIRKLKNFVNVDVYGRCKDLINPDLEDCPRNSETCRKLQKRYKFYLAFENSFCSDYITEKYFKNSLQRHIVPVVVSGANLTNPKIALPKSFINVFDFKSLNELGDYLNYLSGNDTAYNEYHQWNSKYTVEPRQGMCKFCKALWEEKDHKETGFNLKNFWSSDIHCRNQSELLNVYL
ncbi:alpha-(1,3)-fucosyltransferase 10-like [Hydractinia symbiolongicarpus]|uniref:alpha-(1,3)-fucosyltransferase 10-like n=1 Tax=Hydractinia symbiolongicarpus TaxID=13093 RepID=UPI00254AABC2|nr:alpha-(1,3)-fucosyltransferase 10-like [Hydractinia symbiolongicarpus]